MHRAVLLGLGCWLAAAGVALAQGLPEGTFASIKEGCAKLKDKTVTELGADLDFTVLSKTGYQRECGALRLRHRHAAQRDELARHRVLRGAGLYLIPICSPSSQKQNGDLSVTRMTVQQPSYDQTDEESCAVPDDLDPSEVDRPKTDDNQAKRPSDAGADAGTSAQEEASTCLFPLRET